MPVSFSCFPVTLHRMTEPSPKCTEPAATDVRLHSRTHVFVLATLSCAAGSAPIYVRNMSPTGALIEGSTIFPAGTPVDLRRGSLRASGRIVWADGRRAGITFNSAVHVADWMSHRSNTHQHRVDDSVRAVKFGTAIRLSAELEPAVPQKISVPEELEKLRTELSELENTLAGNPALVAACPQIQFLDIALQRIEKILTELAGKEDG